MKVLMSPDADEISPHTCGRLSTREPGGFSRLQPWGQAGSQKVPLIQEKCKCNRPDSTSTFYSIFGIFSDQSALPTSSPVQIAKFVSELSKGPVLPALGPHAECGTSQVVAAAWHGDWGLTFLGPYGHVKGHNFLLHGVFCVLRVISLLLLTVWNSRINWKQKSYHTFPNVSWGELPPMLRNSGLGASSCWGQSFKRNLKTTVSSLDPLSQEENKVSVVQRWRSV